MADNVTSNAGAGGAVFATDDITSVHYPIGKLGFGALDSVTLAASGAGAVSAGVQRMTLASDDPAVALLGTIDADTSALAGTVAGAELQVDIVSAPTLTVNAHAVTNAGTFAVQVDGAALTALQLIDDAIFAEDVASVGADKGVSVMAVRQDTPANTSGTDGDYEPLRMSAGRLWTSGVVTGTVAVTQSGTWDEVGINDSGNSITVDNGGTFAVQVDGAALTALQLIDNTILVDDAAFTPATSSVSMVGFQADESSTDSVDEGDAGAARMTLDRKLIVTQQPHTAGGLTIFRSLDLDESEEEVKGTAGQVYGCWVTNTATSTRWLKFYNDTAANVIVGTTAPVITIGIPGNSSDDISGILGIGGNGVAFSAAITVAATTGVADADTGAPAANDVIVNIFYK